MAAAAFNASDFKAFDTKGFSPRMAVIRSRIRPKLEAIGHSLVPGASRAPRTPSCAHGAGHPGRTVSPPDDPWVALGPAARGYKKTGHFKVAVSRHCVRFLFEGGPDHPAKKALPSAGKKSARGR